MVLRPLLCLLAITCSCGGKPVGSRVPKANPAHVAGAAAAAATLATLADPAAAKHKQEHRGGEREERGKVVKETVPEDVLSRSEEAREQECEALVAKAANEEPLSQEESEQVQACKDEEAKKKAEEKQRQGRAPFLPDA